MKVRVGGESIRLCQEMAWEMDDFQVEVSKVEQPPCLATIKVLSLAEVCQVFMIGEDLNGEGGSVEVVSLGFQGMDDGKEFPVIDVIVSFCRDEQLREVGIGMPVTVQVGLKEDCAGGILRGVHGDGKGFGKIKKVKDKVRKEESFQSVKGLLTSRGPISAIVLFCKVKEGKSDSGIVRDESMVEIGEAQEGLHVFDLGWGGPGSDVIEFDWVHGELTGSYNHPKVFNF